MAPGQGHHHSTLWRDTHSFYLLSPLRGFLSRAWSRLRGPGPPEPWRVEAVIGADQVEAGLELDTKDALATPYILCGRHPQRDVEDSGVPEDKGEADQVPCLGLKANSSPETWGLSDGDDEEYCEEEGSSVPREQGREFKDGQPAHLSSVLLIRSLQNSDRNTGEEAAEEEGVGHHEGVTEFSYPSPHWEGCPAVEEEEDGEAVKKEVPGASPSPISPGFKPSSWVSCPGEKEDQTTEEKGTKNKGAREASISPASSGSNIWECCLGEASKEKGETAGEGGDPEPGALVPAQRSLCRAFDCEPSKKNTEKEEEVSALGVAEKKGGAESPSIPLTCASVRAWVFQTGEDTEDEDSDSGSAEKEGEADSSSSTPTTSAFLKAWVYRPGEDTEDEDDEDSDLGSAEEEGETEAPSSTSSTNAFLKAWVYRPGEDTEDEDDEDSDLGSAEEEGDTEAPSSIPPTSAFLKAWVYRPGEDTEDEDDEDSDLESAEEEGETEAPSSTPPSAFLKAWVYQPGEDTEEEDECEKHEDRLDDSEAGEGGEAADSDSYPSLLDQSTPLRGWICRLGEEADEEAAIKKRKEAEPCPLQVAIYLPGKKPPPPWAAPKLPLRLQRRLKLSEAPIQVSDPETPLKARKVRFSEKVTVHLLAVWAGPAQAARRGPWEQLARDRSRFARRIARAQEELGPCLTPASRATAWARLGNPLSFLSPVPAPTQLLPSPCDPSETPRPGHAPEPCCGHAPPSSLPGEVPAASLDLSGRRG